MGVFMLFELKNVHIAFGQKNVIENFCLRVEKKDRILLLGENGSGKTTLLRYICKNYKNVCRISYLRQQDMLLPHATVFKNLSLAGGAEKTEAFLQQLSLQKYKNDYPYQLSGGVHRRLLILRAMLFPYDLLILDEPLTCLDAASIPPVCEMIRQQTEGRALIVSSHQNTEEFEFTNKTVIV